MSAYAAVDLGKLLRDNDRHLSSLCRTDPLELAKKIILQNCIVTDCQEYSFFKSLDHSRVDPQLQVRYLLRLVSVRVSEDESVWEKFMTLLASMGERQMYDYLSELISSNAEKCHRDSSLSCLDIPLSIEDIPWILEVLVKASHKWEQIAIMLTIPQHEIENCRQRDNKLNLNNILTCWLARGTSTPSGVTMNALLAVLRSEVVGEGRVAQELEDKYKHTKQSYHTPQLTTCSSQLSLTEQSYDIEVEDSKSTLLQVQASPRESVCYQWKKDGRPLENSRNYSGVDEDILIVSQASQGTEGEYTCCVSYRGSEKCSNKITLTIHYLPAKKRLLDLYSVHREVPPDSWPPIGTKSFVNLTVIQSAECAIATKESAIDKRDRLYCNEVFEAEDTKAATDKRVAVDYNEVFGKYSSRTLIVAKGRPGCGKTTLVHKIVIDWSKGMAIRKARFVFLITLRITNRKTKQETLSSILESFYHSEEELRKVCEEIEAVNGEGICFIIDGLDEYHPQDRDSSLIYKLLEKTFLPLAMIIVTSRPLAVKHLSKLGITHKVEVLGFNKEQILEYIDSFPFTSSSCDSQAATTYPAKLKEYLYNHPNVFNMCYLPVHAAMICFLFKYHKGNLPNTQTKIYQEFTRSTILRHLRRHDSEAQVHSLQELTGNTKDHFSKLCYLAYDMTFNRKQIATPEVMGYELRKYVSNNSDEWCLGLVTINHIAELSGITKAFSFLHLTVQEFLTAYYITTLDEDVQISLLSQRDGRLLSSQLPTLSALVKIFYFGLVQFQSEFEIHVLDQFLSSVSSDILNMRTVLHCALESQQQIVCDKVGEHFKGKYVLYHSTPLDLYPLSYVICTTTHPVIKVSLNSSRYGDCDYTDFLTSISRRDLSCLEVLKLSDKLNYTAALALSDLLRNCTSLGKVELNFREISHPNAKAITDTLKHLDTPRYLIIRFYSTSGGITTLLGGLTHSKLGLVLEFRDIDTKGMLEISSGLHHFSSKLPIYRCLAFSRCCIDDEAATALASGLHSALNFKELDISHCRISHFGVVTLLNKIYCITKLRELTLSHNNIDCEGATPLRYQQSLTKPVTANLVRLKLSYNIELFGAVRLADLLHNLTKLWDLDLSDSNIGPDGAVSVAGTLHHLTKLNILGLWNDNIGQYGMVSLASTLHHLTHLSDLRLSNNNIGPEGAASLAGTFHYLTNLKYFYLSHNNIGPDGAASLASKLHHLTNLVKLFLSHNNIGPDGAVSLASAIHHLTHLTGLDLAHNNIHLRSAITVIDVCKNNQILFSIHLNCGDTENYYSYGIHVEGLVSPEDNTAIADLMAAVQHRTQEQHLHLGFRTIRISPVISRKSSIC